MKRSDGNRGAEHVDFKYAFATPHRLTVALPDSSDKTLLDAHPGWLRMAWTYDNLRDKPLAAFVVPKTEWEVHIKPELDGHPFGQSRWTRAEGWLPVLENVYEDSSVTARLEVAGGATAAIVRVEVANAGKKTRRVALRCEKPGNWSGYNPAWVQPEWDADVLLAGWQDRADRVIVFAVGGDLNPVPAPSTLCLSWTLRPGEHRTAWLIRPYRAYEAALPALRKKNWSREFDSAQSAWRRLIRRAAQITIPDSDVENAFRACLADCFVMREPVAGGAVVGVPGTECYRAPNSGEPLIASVLFDQLGLHKEAAGNAGPFLRLQGRDGNWADPEGWCHYVWGVSGFKAWAIMEHYRLTGDRRYLAAVFPRMAASSRWQESQRKRTRILLKGKRPLTYGLMPRGMGDCGLMGADGSFYGVFLPHNILAVFADAMTVEAARILGRKKDLPVLRRIHTRAIRDLNLAMNDGAMAENGYRWIPGVPGRSEGSRWGALYAAFPCRILPPGHELISGTIRKFEARMSPGGIPVHTGWMKDGMWVGITLDNLAEVLLLRADGDAAARYLYATLNHGTPAASSATPSPWRTAARFTWPGAPPGIGWAADSRSARGDSPHTSAAFPTRCAMTGNPAA
ncbi:MAG: hypothetical protein NTV86_03165 [Planctomycetota bacterium]|nr:hypothetical protein [Planctomycetota bacterium]